MCGINAVNSFDAIRKSVLIAIEQQNRGIQGCGVAYLNKQKIRVMKRPISPTQFYNLFCSRLPKNKQIAICHNRMPSQGGVEYVNTHPFLSCGRDFALIHNGNANVSKIGKLLRAHGHRIRGKTDSEVLCHVLEIYLRMMRMRFEALKEFAEDYLGGAIIVLMKNGEIYGVRDRHYPLNLVKTDKGIYLASEAEAIKEVVEQYGEEVLEEFSLEPFQPIKITGIKYYYNGKRETCDLLYWYKRLPRFSFYKSYFDF